MSINQHIHDRDLSLIMKEWIVQNPNLSIQQQMDALLRLAQEDKKNNTLSVEEVQLLQQRCQRDIESLQSEAQLEWRIFLQWCQSPSLASQPAEMISLEKDMLLTRKFITIEKWQRLWDIIKTYYPEAQTDAQIVQTLNALVAFQKNNSLKNRLLQDTLWVWGKIWKDGVLWDKILIWDRLEIPSYTDLFPSK